MHRLICDFVVVPRGLKQVSDHKAHLKVIFIIQSIGITCENKKPEYLDTGYFDVISNPVTFNRPLSF